jgi:hypothetical protein
MPAPKDAPQIGAGDPSKDGQRISQNDPLIELDQTGLQADHCMGLPVRPSYLTK